jgi:hypothetical protein
MVLGQAFAAAAGQLYLQRQSPESQRRLYKIVHTVVGALWIVVAVYLLRDSALLWLALPMAILVTYLNIRASRFCAKCGQQYLAVAAKTDDHKYCSKCGEPLLIKNAGAPGAPPNNPLDRSGPK